MSHSNHGLPLQHPDFAGPSYGAQIGFSRRPSHQDIARLAYDHFLRRGSRHGEDQNDWAAAEKELQSARPSR